MRTLVLAAVLAGLQALAPPPGAAANWIEDVVNEVRDGDTIVVGGRPVRLKGAHAPELREAGGIAARRWMAERVLGRRLACRLEGGRSHDRLVAVCYDSGGDLAAQLVASDLGRDCPRFSRGAYAGHETEAGRRLPLPAYCLPRTAIRPRRDATTAIAAGAL